MATSAFFVAVGIGCLQITLIFSVLPQFPVVFMEKNVNPPNDVKCGTNCYNCKYVADKVEAIYQEELNSVGGIDPKGDFEIYRAQATDLITLPDGSKDDAADKRHCHHPKVNMFVTARMCCALWDHDKVKRPWQQSNQSSQ